MLGTLVILFFFIKGYKKEIFVSIIFVLLSFCILINYNQGLKNRYDFIKKNIWVKEIIFKNSEQPETFKNGPKIYLEEYVNIYFSSVVMIKNKFFFGYGKKNYYKKCIELEEFSKIKKVCSTHPHNIYLEILILGGLISLLLFLIFLFEIVKKIFEMKKRFLNIKFFLLVFILIEFFPLRTYGSIFSTINGHLFYINRNYSWYYEN